MRSLTPSCVFPALFRPLDEISRPLGGQHDERGDVRGVSPRAKSDIVDRPPPRLENGMAGMRASKSLGPRFEEPGGIVGTVSDVWEVGYRDTNAGPASFSLC